MSVMAYMRPDSVWISISVRQILILEWRAALGGEPAL
jgi:hypothetical protein